MYTSNSWHYSCPRSVCCQSIVSHVSEYIWISNFFFADSASVLTYPVNPAYESSPLRIRSPEWKFLNTLWIRNCALWTLNPEFLFIQWHKEIEPFLNREYSSTMSSSETMARGSQSGRVKRRDESFKTSAWKLSSRLFSRPYWPPLGPGSPRMGQPKIVR